MCNSEPSYGTFLKVLFPIQFISVNRILNYLQINYNMSTPKIVNQLYLNIFFFTTELLVK